MYVGTFTHNAPGRDAPGKHYRPDGTSETQGSFKRMHYQTASFASLAHLHGWLMTAPGSIHMSAGIASVSEAEAYETNMATRLLASGDGTCPETGRHIITRTNADVSFYSGPGMMVFDTDGIGDFDYIYGALIAAAPGLMQHAMLHTSSSGSRIIDADGSVIRGDNGAHTFLHVMDANDIPRALEVAHKRMVLAGYARHRIAKGINAAFLNRSLVDLQLRVPSQPIFIRAHLAEGMTQDKVYTLRPGVEMVDTRTVFPELSEGEELAYEGAIAQALLDMKGEMEMARAARSADAVAGLVASGMSETDARVTVQAVAGGDLGPDFQIVLSNGTIVTVEQILADPGVYHGQTCCDPSNPDRNRKTVAKIYSNQMRPMIHSFAHGGANYRLHNDLSGVAPENDQDWLNRHLKAAQDAIDASVVLQWSLQPVNRDCDAVLAHLDNPTGAEIPGVGLVLGNRRVRCDPERLCQYIKGHPGRMPDWARLMVVCAGITHDTLEEGATIAAKTFSAVTKPNARGALLNAVTAQENALPVLIPVSGEIVDPPAEADLEQAKHSAELLSQCKHIADDPLGSLDASLSAHGIVGERRVANATFLTLVSSNTGKLINLINKGQSSAGKSYVTKSVLKRFPDAYVFPVSSMSAKALVYQPSGFFIHKHIFLEEGEALVRTNDGEKNEFAEMCRVLLSEGRLIHAVVERDPETGKHQTVMYEQEGPTGLITTTTRGHLDSEIETRMMSVWLDESPEHSQKIVQSIAEQKESEAQSDQDVSDWYAYAEWLRLGGPYRVVIPFATKVAEHVPTKSVRVRRDINSLFATIEASAVANRLHRDATETGAIIATWDDYELAVACVGQSISEGHEVVASENARSMLGAMSAVFKDAVVKAGGWATQTQTTWQLAQPQNLPSHVEVGTDQHMLPFVALKGSERKLCDVLNMSKTTYRRHMKHVIGEGYVDHPMGKNQLYRITIEGWDVIANKHNSIFPDRKKIEDGISPQIGGPVDHLGASP